MTDFGLISKSICCIYLPSIVGFFNEELALKTRPLMGSSKVNHPFASASDLFQFCLPPAGFPFACRKVSPPVCIIPAINKCKNYCEFISYYLARLQMDSECVTFNGQAFSIF